MSEIRARKKIKLLEDNVQILKIDRLQGPLSIDSYYFIYFIDENCIAFYKKNQKSRLSSDLPLELIFLEDLLNVNFRIPQKLNNLDLNFKNEGSFLSLFFQNEMNKNEVGDHMKKQIKKMSVEWEKKVNGKEFDAKIIPDREYTSVELKYKLSKMMEGLLNSRKY